MNAVTIPDFGELLAEHLGQVPPEVLPFMLSQLERSAAARYREWAEQVPGHRQGLLECAAREDEIADRVEAMFPPTEQGRELVASLIPAARATYYEVFSDYSAIDQMTIQANAERQGANAWQGLKEAYPQLAAKLDELSAIEIRSADYLDRVIASPEVSRD